MSRFLSKRFETLEAYVPGEQPQDMQYIKLNTNEAPFPPSPSVYERLNVSELQKLNLYPDPEGSALRGKLAALYGVAPENIFLSNGSDEVLAFAFMAFCDAEKPVVFPDITYPFYPFTLIYTVFRTPRFPSRTISPSASPIIGASVRIS